MSSENDLKSLIKIKTRRLQKLKEQQALKGVNADPALLIEIEDLEAEIEQLRGGIENSDISKQRVQIYLQGDFSSLSTDRRSAAIDAFASVMGISSQEIEVYRVYQGSIVFDLGVPSDAVERLRSLLQSNNRQLHLLKIEKVTLERESGNEEWVIREGKFELVISYGTPESIYRKPQSSSPQKSAGAKQQPIKPRTINWEKIGAIAGVVSVFVAMIALAISPDLRSFIFSSNTPTPVFTQASDFVVKVDDTTGQPVSKVEILFRSEGSTADFRSQITDSSGIARFTNVLIEEKNSIKISISDNRYEEYEKNLTIDRNNPFFDVRLTPKVVSITTPTSPPTNTPTATSSIPTNTPTPIPPTLTNTPIPLSNTSTPTPTPTKTTRPTNTPTSKSTPTTSPAATVTGRLAIPLGGPKVYITDTKGNLLGYLDMARQPDYRRDGTMLVVNGDGGSLDKLRISNPIGQEQQEIGDPGLAGHEHPVWSPDGKQVMYDDHTIGGAIWHIFRRDINNTDSGAGEEIMAADGPIVGQNPMWTTGDRFVFRGCKTWTNQASECGLWMMQGNRGNPVKLSKDLNQIPTDIDGDTLVYVSNDGDDDWNVYKMDITDGVTRQLTFNPAADGLATISPDGLSVAFLSNRQGGLAVWWVGINGGNPQKMFDIPAEWGTLRSDGWSEEKLSWGG